ncbi:class I SAM-dependent methyltransferase [Cuniculiplasma sp. SKW3]|uniref:class I SAM-dependent methyltransferase n=1 Tax=Cuniculiplasma sp. SKW3 TaxID=3400170 RepID=UPI003FD6B515
MPDITPRDFYSSHGVKWLSSFKKEEWTEKELLYLKNMLRKDWRILDLACGYGRFTIPLGEEGYHMEGLDITPVFIEEAKDRAKLRNLNIQFTEGDMRKTPYSDECFNSVICMWNAFSELISVDDQIMVLKEIYRILKKNGIGLIEVRNHRSPGPVQNNQIQGEAAMPTYNHTRGSMKNILTRAGIKNYEISLEIFGLRKRLIVKIIK